MRARTQGELLRPFRASDRTCARGTQVEILRLFRHKYIVGYYDSFYEDGDLHICMEFADGGCLYAVARARSVNAA